MLLDDVHITQHVAFANLALVADSLYGIFASVVKGRVKDALFVISMLSEAGKAGKVSMTFWTLELAHVA